MIGNVKYEFQLKLENKILHIQELTIDDEKSQNFQPIEKILERQNIDGTYDVKLAIFQSKYSKGIFNDLEGVLDFRNATFVNKKTSDEENK